MKISLWLSLQNGLREWVFFKEVSKSNEIVFYWLFAQFSFFVSLILGCLLLATAPWGGGGHTFLWAFSTMILLPFWLFFFLLFFYTILGSIFSFGKSSLSPKLITFSKKLRLFFDLEGEGGGSYLRILDLQRSMSKAFCLLKLN